MNYFEKLALREAAEAQAEERREARRQRTEKILVRLIGEAIFQPKDKRAAPQVDAENGARLVSLSEDLHDLLHAVGRVVQLLAVAEEEAEARP